MLQRQPSKRPSAEHCFKEALAINHASSEAIDEDKHPDDDDAPSLATQAMRGLEDPQEESVRSKISAQTLLRNNKSRASKRKLAPTAEEDLDGENPWKYPNAEGSNCRDRTKRRRVEVPSRHSTNELRSDSSCSKINHLSTNTEHEYSQDHRGKEEPSFRLPNESYPNTSSQAQKLGSNAFTATILDSTESIAGPAAQVEPQERPRELESRQDSRDVDNIASSWFCISTISRAVTYPEELRDVTKNSGCSIPE